MQPDLIIINDHGMASSDVEIPRCAQQLFDHWRSRAEPPNLPCKSQMTPYAMKPWLGNLSVVENREGEPHLFMRLIGTEVARYINKDLTGKFLDEHLPPHAREVIIEPFNHCHKARKPVFMRIERGILTGDFDWIDRLILPMTEDSGDKISHFLSWMYAKNFTRKPGADIYGMGPSKSPPLRRRRFNLRFNFYRD